MEKLELAYDSWGDGVLKYLNIMRNASQMCDVRILLEQDEVLLAHSCVLAASSPFFMSILDGEHEAEIDLGEFPGEIIKQVLEFIYSGQSSVDLAELDLLFAVAETLKISVLADMVKGISEQNASTMTIVKEEPSYVSQGSNSITLDDAGLSLDMMNSLTETNGSMEKIRSPKPKCKRGRPKKNKLHPPTGPSLKEIETKPSELNMADDGSDHFENIDMFSETLQQFPEQDAVAILNNLTSLETAEITPDELLSSQPGNDTSDNQQLVRTLFKIEDAEVPCNDSQLDSSRARQTIPDILVFGSEVEETRILGSEDEGIFSSSKVYIPKDILFGPFEGDTIQDLVETGQNQDTRYCWKIKHDDNTVHWINSSDESKANWMKFVNHTEDEQQQNLKAFIHGGELFYRTICDIPPNVELLVAYTDQYEDFNTKSESPVKNRNEKSDDSVYVSAAPFKCKECQAAYASDIVYYKHMRSKHNQAMPLDVYMKIQKGKNITANPIVIQPESRDDEDSEDCSWLLGAESPTSQTQTSGMTKRNKKCTKNQAKPDGEKRKKYGKQKENTRKKYQKKDPDSYICSVCGRELKTQACLIQHEDVHVEDKPYQCPKCGKRFVREKAYNNHRMRHDAKRAHQCSICGRGFLQAKPLEIHMRRHTGERPYKCETCGKAFTDIGNLDRHRRLHTGEKPYKCSTCGKCFAQSGHLREHIRGHTGDKPFGCEQCSASFTNKSNLLTHIRVHTKEKPFKCNECGKSYRDATYLKSHMRLHTGEKPYVCMDCGMAFSDNSKMRFHRRKFHQAGFIRPPKVNVEIKIINIDESIDDAENSNPALLT